MEEIEPWVVDSDVEWGGSKPRWRGPRLKADTGSEGWGLREHSGRNLWASTWLHIPWMVGRVGRRTGSSLRIVLTAWRPSNCQG